MNTPAKFIMLMSIALGMQVYGCGTTHEQQGEIIGGVVGGVAGSQIGWNGDNHCDYRRHNGRFDDRPSYR